ncbi:helix-turn-helix domain-containing protein [Lacticaseibacillus pabuli]|uniref:Helix-turn-helix domain-containing protein n=1 Tax=Lacticaseibacillus pabuli TaxID=3025672 RepID=A0ABY7WTR9_9LACO|nr:helix-turn-helix domain-containing protein [Lacticaseibacillus sp. KACC 23028]WDF82434.1 helix-turn-helix domain-containing protein [Lacticaseibacillus sp. KACC 23028]
MFENLFFDKRSEVAYRLFKLMKSLSGNSLTVSRLSTLMDLSYPQTYKAHQEVYADLVKINKENLNRDVTEEATFQELAENISVECYRFFLLQQSLAFRFIDEAFRNDGADIGAFAKAAGLSTATIRRRLDPFRDLMQRNKLYFDQVSWAPRGPEFGLRCLLDTFYYEGYRGGPWPFEKVISQDEARQIYLIINQHKMLGVDQTDVISRGNLIMIGVMKMRLAQGHAVPISTRFDQLVPYEKNPDNEPFTTTYFPGITERVLTNEMRHYHFVRAVAMSSSPYDTQGGRELREHLHSFANPVDDFVQHVLNELTADMDSFSKMHTRGDVILQSNMYRLGTAYYVMNGPYVRSSDFAERNVLQNSGRGVYAQVAAAINGIPDSEASGQFKRFMPDIAESLFSIIRANFADFDAAPVLKVTVEVDQRELATDDMLQFLQDMNVIQLIPQNHANEADVVISSSSAVNDMIKKMGYTSEDARQPEIIYWGLENHDLDLFRLAETIRNIASAKAGDQASGKDSHLIEGY